MKITRAVVPSLFTVLNIFCGLLSIVHASKGEIELGAWFIILAGVFDSLDGVMARITRSSSQFGVELDSLADVVSFGVAPSVLVYQGYLQSLNTVGLLISAMPLVFGAIRLARFNVQLVGFEKDSFKGLPIPASALTLCAFFLEYHSEGYGLADWSRVFLGPLVVALSLLMVSRVKYETFPKLSKKGIRTHPWRMLFFSSAALAVLVSGGRLLFLVLVTFIAFGIVRSFIESLRRLLGKIDRDPEEESEVTSVDI